MNPVYTYMRTCVVCRYGFSNDSPSNVCDDCLKAQRLEPERIRLAERAVDEAWERNSYG